MGSFFSAFPYHVKSFCQIFSWLRSDCGKFHIEPLQVDFGTGSKREMKIEDHHQGGGSKKFIGQPRLLFFLYSQKFKRQNVIKVV